MRTCLLIFFALLFTPLYTTAQDNNLYQQLSNESLPRTLVYLQTDKGVYQPGEEIRFKGYVMDAQLLVPSALDTTLYVQLLTLDSNTVIHQEKILIQNGFAEGYIPLQKTLSSGNYLLAAFTRESFGKDSGEFKTCRSVRIWKGEPQERNRSSAPEKAAQLSFMPEGGNLVAGLLNTVGFKACSENGKPVDFEGTLYEDDKAIADLKSTHKGMGKFLFIPQPGKKYVVRATGSGISHSLPEIQTGGVILKKVRQTQKQVTFLAVKTPETPLDKVWISARIRRVVYGVSQGTFQRDSLVINLPTTSLPQGIMEFTLYNSGLLPLAERLVYVNAGQNLTLTTTLSKSTYLEKEKVTLKIKAEDPEGNPVTVHLGLSVFDQFFKNHTDQLNIVSYTHLYSQVRGNIDEPGYYFDQKNADRLEALDLLLMTQGWRRYVYSKSETQKYMGYIPNLVAGTIQSKKALPSILLAFPPDRSSLGSPVEVSQEGTFTLGIENMLLGNFYIKPLGDEEVSKSAKISFSEPFKIINDIVSGKQVIYSFTSPQADSPDIPKLRGSIQLNEVVITGKGKVYTDPYMATLDSMAKYTTEYIGRCGLLNCASCGHGTQPVEGARYKRYKDGTQPYHGRRFTPDEITIDPYEYPKYTEEELLKKFNIYRVKGFQVHKEFYSPDYAADPTSLSIFDPRTTLAWKPDIITDEKGEAQVEFYTSDLEGVFIGNIEGLNGSGLLGVAGFSFQVTNPRK